MDVTLIARKLVESCTRRWIALTLCSTAAVGGSALGAEVGRQAVASDVVILVSDASPSPRGNRSASAATASRTTSANGHHHGSQLSVVANASRTPLQQPFSLKGAATAMASDAQVREAGAVHPVAAPNYDALPAIHSEPVREAEATLAPASERVSMDQLTAALISAHQLSQMATTEKEFSEIVKRCRPAIAASEGELDEESRDFAHRLSAWALNRRGQLRADRNEGDQALADFDVAVQLDATNYRALHHRGVTLAERGDFAAAFDDFSRVIATNPEFSKAYANRATLYVHAGKSQEALDDYQSALDRNPEMFAAHLGRGRVCHGLGRISEALTHFNAALRLEPDRADAVCSRGDLHADAGNYAEALGDYARAIEIDPKCTHAYRNGSWLLATCPDSNVRDGENALRGAEQALKFSASERHASLDALAAALACCGRFSEAVGTMQQALDLAPEEARATYHARIELYESRQPFLSHPVAKVEQSSYSQVRSSGESIDN